MDLELSVQLMPDTRRLENPLEALVSCGSKETKKNRKIAMLIEAAAYTKHTRSAITEEK